MPLKPLKLKPRLDKIKKNPKLIFNYAHKIMKQRWPEAEPYIIKDPFWASHYAQHVIQGRWPEAEPTIKRDALAYYLYSQFLRNKKETSL